MLVLAINKLFDLGLAPIDETNDSVMVSRLKYRDVDTDEWSNQNS